MFYVKIVNDKKNVYILIRKMIRHSKRIDENTHNKNNKNG